MSTPPPYQRPTYEVARHSARAEATRRSDGDVGRDDQDFIAPEIRRSAWVVRAVVALIAVVALAVTAFLGGFDQVVSTPSTTVPAVAVGEEFNGGPWLIRVESAQIGHDLRDYKPQNEGDLVLQVNVGITVVDTRTWSILEAVTLKTGGTEPVKAERIRYLRDNREAYDVQPGLPERLAYLWAVPKGTTVPHEITIVIKRYERRYQNFRFLGSALDFDLTEKATVTVPLLDRTATT